METKEIAHDPNEKKESKKDKNTKKNGVTFSIPDEIVVGTHDTPHLSKYTLYGILATNIFMGFGRDFCNDFPQLLAPELINKLNITTFEISLFYALYSGPSIFLLPISSYIISKIGPDRSALVSTFIVLVGEGIILVGIYRESYLTMIIGRIIFGIGSEYVNVLQCTINEIWFYGNFLSIAYSWNNVSSFTANVLSAFFTPEIFVRTGNVRNSFILGFFTCMIGCMLGIVYYLSHKKHIQTNRYIRMSEIEGLLEIASQSRNNSTQQSRNKGPSFLTAFKSLNYRFLILALEFILLNGLYYQYMNISTEILVKRFNFPYEQTNKINLIAPLSGIIIGPILSQIVDSIGQKPIWMLIASSVSLVNYFSMYRTITSQPSTIYLHYIGLGVEYSIFASTLYSSIVLSVPTKYVGFAFSILISIQNTSGFLFPFYFGTVAKERSYEAYNNCIVSLVGLSLFTLVCSTIIFLMDVNGDKLLSLRENSIEVKRIRGSIDQENLMYEGEDEEYK